MPFNILNAADRKDEVVNVRPDPVYRQTPVCKDCGRDHFIEDCPYKGCPGTNITYEEEWPSSKMGRAWAFWNYKCMQLDRSLPNAEPHGGLPLRDPKAQAEAEYKAKRARYGDNIDDDTPATDRRGKSDRSLEDRSRAQNRP